MRKLLIITLLFVAIACSKGISEKDVIGKYKVTFVMNSAENADEESGLAMAMFANADVKYEFLEGGVLNSTVSMGSLAQDNAQVWKMSGDSIFLDLNEKPDEYFTIIKEGSGFMLTGGAVNLKLTKID